MRHPELLLPAGSPEVLRTAVRYGADAVYLGGEAMSLRAKARNFTPAEMREGIAFAHAHGAKVHITANIFAHEYDLAEAEAYFAELEEMRPDAVLIADPGMLSLAKRFCPHVPIHLSTQANTTNSESCRFWYEAGVKRIVLARELSVEEIGRIRREVPPDLELECFIHGAMCISYSGRCLLSNAMAGRDANRGLCTHPCRWQYAVVEASRPGEYYPVEESARGTFIFNSRDLCMVGHLPELYAAGIDCFKIEGRMKTALYAAAAARTYRMAMRDFEEDPERYAARIPCYMEQISSCTYRPYTTGFYFGKPSEEAQIYDGETYVNAYTYLGTAEKVSADGGILLSQKNKFSAGDTVEVMHPDGCDSEGKVVRIVREDGTEVPSAPHPKERLFVFLDPDPGAEAGDILRMKTKK